MKVDFHNFISHQGYEERFKLIFCKTIEAITYSHFLNNLNLNVKISSLSFHQMQAPYKNDIALIRLPAPARPSQVVQVVCLPMETLSPDSRQVGVVVGWGKTSNDQSISNLTGVYTAKQQKLEVIPSPALMEWYTDLSNVISKYSGSYSDR